MKKILAIALSALMLLSALTVFVSAEEATAEVDNYIKATFGTPVIDGEIDSIWDTAEIHKAQGVFANDEITEPSSLRFRVMYDEYYVYVLAEVTDYTMPTMEDGLAWETNGSNSWYNKDGVSFVFGPDNNKDVTGSYTAPAFWYIIRAFGTAANYNQVDQAVFVTEDEGAVIADQNDFEKHPMEKRMYAISYRKDKDGNLIGYTIESKVNLKVRYADIKMEAGTKIGFDMYLNDNNYLLISASRNYGLYWVSVASYKDNSQKGTVEFADKSYKAVNTEEVVTTAEATTEEITTAAPVVTTAKPVETTAEPVVTTAVPETEAVETAAPAVETSAEVKEEKSGCGSAAAAGLAVIILMGSAFVFKKH